MENKPERRGNLEKQPNGSWKIIPKPGVKYTKTTPEEWERIKERKDVPTPLWELALTQKERDELGL